MLASWRIWIALYSRKLHIELSSFRMTKVAYFVKKNLTNLMPMAQNFVYLYYFILFGIGLLNILF